MTAQQNLSRKTTSIRWMAGAAVASLLSFGGSANAFQWATANALQVKLTNLTYGQVLTPPLVVIHSSDFHLFVAGEPASPELAALATEGHTDLLKTALESDPAVCQVQVGSDAIPPTSMHPSTTSLMVTLNQGIGPVKLGQGNCTHLSVVTMLANTNDAFAAIDAWRLPMNLPLLRYLGNGSVEQRVHGSAYDAGAEINDELCESIPGPACGTHDAGAPENGVVHIHPGVHGIVGATAVSAPIVRTSATGLVPADHDWQNPVIELDLMTSTGK